MDRAIKITFSGFIAGVFLASVFSLDYSHVALAVLIAAGLLALSFYGKEKKLFISIIFFFLSLALGIGRYELSDRNYVFTIPQNEVTIEGMIAEEPEERESYTRLVVWANLYGQREKILVYARQYPALHYGDKLVMTGRLEEPKNNFPQGGEREFDWKAYLAKENIYFTMSYPDTEVTGRGHGNFIYSTLFKIKGKFLEAIGRSIAEPNAALLGGITVGARKSIPKDVTEVLRRVGIVHIVVLSGYNITIVSQIFVKLFGALSAFLGVSLGVLGIVLFTLMTGASATIVRASIMAIIALIARSSGKTYAVTRALFLAVFIMILENPKILRFDASFQLSFLATLGLIYLSPILEKRFRFLPNTLNLREAVVATVGTQIFVLPLLLYTSGVLSLVSLPVNLLTLIVVPLTMFFGFLAGGVGIVSAIVATPFAWISYTLSEYILQVGRIFSKIPFGSLTINYFPFWLMVGIYTLYAWGIVTLRKKQDV